MSKEYKRGDTLLISSPFVHVLSSKERATRCGQCFTNRDDLLRCSACKLPRYCDRSCQKSAWRFHKYECPCLKRVSPHVPTDSVRLLYRLLLKLQKYDGQREKEEAFGQIRTFQDLISHVEEIEADSERMAQFVELTKTLSIYSGQTIDLPPTHQLLIIYGKMVINSFSISDSEMRPIGVGLYLGASVLDHSCKPNAVAVFSGTTAHIRCIQPVGVQKYGPNTARVSYVDLLQLTSRRQHDLERQYYFTCDCDRCQDSRKNMLMLATQCTVEACPGPVIANKGMMTCCSCECNGDRYMVKREVQLENASKTVTALKKLVNNTEIIERCEECLKELTVLHTDNMYIIKLWEIMFDASIESSQWQKAVQYGKLLLDGYRRYLDAFHPLVGVHLVKLGKLLNYLGEVSSARQYLIQAEEVLAVTHGKTHTLYGDLVELLAQSSAELQNKLTAS